ncbi:hypothetical protein B835_867 [Enterococcus mundtii 3F]|nr:hypothetical protein [Enterococcus mundtii 3F]
MVLFANFCGFFVLNTFRSPLARHEWVVIGCFFVKIKK